MIVVCRNCGYPNNVKNVSFKSDYLKTVCRKCGFETSVATGTTGVKEEPVEREETGRDLLSTLFPVEEESTRGEASAGESEGEADRTTLSKKFGRSMAVLMLFIVLPVIVSTFGNLYDKLKTTEAVNVARSYAAESEEIKRLVGSDLTMELHRVQLARDSEDVERARIEMEVSAEDGAGTVVMYMERRGREWVITSAQFVDSTSRQARPLTVP